MRLLMKLFPLRMMNKLSIENKEYTWIFWDWLSTLYDSDTGNLYPWVMGFLEQYSKMNFILVTRAADPVKRLTKIESSEISKYFKKIYTTDFDKRDDFQNALDEFNIFPDEVLVVGDNPNSEITAARELGLDAMLIQEFVSKLSL